MAGEMRVRILAARETCACARAPRGRGLRTDSGFHETTHGPLRARRGIQPAVWHYKFTTHVK
jgi:hypothetical protein